MKAVKLIHHLGLLLFLLGVGLSGLALTAIGQEKSDAIAIRVVANPERLSISEWYAREQIGGSPQSIMVDGYEAIRNNRTVYVAAANISNPGIFQNAPSGLVYSNIYIITYSQGAGSITEDIFGKILSKWRFNTNLIGDYGFCFKDQYNNFTDDPYLNKSCTSDDSCGEFKCQDGKCRPKFSCRLDSDCALETYCSSPQAKIIRDLNRYQAIVSLKKSLTDYMKLNGRYPVLASGTYLPGVAMSVWPSWSTTFTSAIGAGSIVDPINKLGVCDGFDTSTCWSVEKKLFYASSTASSLVLPANSRAIVYRSTATNGASYQLCTGMETALTVVENASNIPLSQYNCATNAYSGGTNLSPVFTANNLVGQTGKEFKGYISASDPEGDSLRFFFVDQPTYSSAWARSLVIKDTSNPNQKMIYSPLAPVPGSYNIKLLVRDNFNNDSGVVSFTIKINSAPTNVIAESVDYDLNPAQPLNYNVYFEAADLSSVELSFSQTLTLIKQALAAGAAVDPYDLSCASPNSAGPWTWNIATDLGVSKTINNCMSASLQQEAQSKYRLNISGIVKGYNQPSTAYFNYSLKLNKAAGAGSATVARAKIKVNHSLPILDLRCSRQAVLNKYYECQVINSNNVPVKTYSLGTTAPDGLSISSSTGMVSGVPRNVGDFKIDIKANNYYNGTSSIAYDLKIGSECGNLMVKYDGGPWNSDGSVKNQGGYYRTILIGDQCWLRDNLNVKTWAREDDSTLTCPAGTTGVGKKIGDLINNPIIVDGTSEAAPIGTPAGPTSRIKSFFSNLFNVALAQFDAFTPSKTSSLSLGKCYAGLENFCYAEGRLYTFEEATAASAASTITSNVKGICPAGFHVPSDIETKTLEGALSVPSGELNSTGFRGINTSAFHKFKLDGDSGFDALLTGAYVSTTSTTTLQMTYHNQTHFWSSSFISDKIVTRYLLDGNDGIGRQAIFAPNKEYAPLRCIMDKPCASNCAANEECNFNGQCVAKCIPNCSGKTCGNNGCGGSCGMCGVTDNCLSGNCVANPELVNDVCSGH